MIKDYLAKIDPLATPTNKGLIMKYSSFNWWKHKGKRGWIIGPFFGYQLSVVLESKGNKKCT